NREQKVLNQKIGFDVDTKSVGVAQWNRQVFIEKSIADPPLHSGIAIEIPIIDECRAIAFRLRKQKHHSIDVLLGEIDYRHKQSASRKIGYVLVASDVAGIYAWELQTMIQYFDLTLLRVIDKLLRRQFAAEIIWVQALWPF